MRATLAPPRTSLASIAGAIPPAPDVEIGEPSVIAGLVKTQTRTADGTNGSDSLMVLLLDLDALSLTRQLDIAA